MTWTRRQWLLAAGSIPLQFGALAELAAQGISNRGRNAPRDSLPPLGPPPTLPDKASFPRIKGVSLNGAATHPRPAGANALIRRTAAALTGEPEGFRPSEARIRETYARMMGADADEIIFVPSTQAGESLIATALGLPMSKGHVVSDYLHFVGSQMMYTDMAKRGLRVTWVPMRDNRIPYDRMDKAIVKGKTRLVAVSSTSFVTGFQHDLKRVCDMAHAKGAFVYADIIQSAGNVPLDLHASGVDAACAGTYKWLMSSGTAFLYVRRQSMAQLQRPVYHWQQESTPLPTTHMYPFDAPGSEIVEQFSQVPGAQGVFAMGYEPSPVALAGLEYSLPYILNIGLDRIQAHAQVLTERLKDELPKRGYPLMTPRDARSPIVTVAARNAEQLAPGFKAAGVNVTTRWNHIRIAPSVFNDMDDVEHLLAALPKAGG